jgi:hypothetical protein
MSQDSHNGIQRGRLFVWAWLGVYPVVTIISWLFGEALLGLPLALRTLIISGLIVGYMLFFWMPLVGRFNQAVSDRSDHSMTIVLWILQVLLSIFFLLVGVTHFIVPPGLPGPLSWMYELPAGLHYFSGTAEMLAALGLILPGLTKIQTRLTPLAGAGLVLVMVGGIVWHVQRGEGVNIFVNLILAVLAGFVAYGRWRLNPLPDRSALPNSHSSARPTGK